MSQTLALPLDAIRAYCETQPIKRLALFGSALRGEMHAESDVDLLVEYEAGARISLFDVVRMQRELGEIIAQQVDLRTAQDLSRYFRDQVLEAAQVIYEKVA